MRIKIQAQIIEKTKPLKTNYSHEIYSMILNQLSTELAQDMHKKEKKFKLLTFTNICINKDLAHFYVAGDDSIVSEFIKYLDFNQLFKIDDMILKVTNISLLPNLVMKDEYMFKTKVIINTYNHELGKNQLTEDLSILKNRLIKNSKDKAKTYGFDGDIQIDIINPKQVLTRYKSGHIFSYKCLLKIKADFNIVNTIYNVGIGENTATGHGFMWEVNSGRN